MDDLVTRLQSDTPDVGVEPLTANRKTPSMTQAICHFLMRKPPLNALYVSAHPAISCTRA